MVDGILLMVEEHKYIKRMLVVVRKACLGIMNGEEVNYNDLSKIISFIKNYADKHHHGKEEKILFEAMVEELGATAEKLVRLGMLVEHDMGRFHIQQLEEAIIRLTNGHNESKLDIIANAISYTDLLSRHIDKEDKVVYTYAKRQLSKETLDKINVQCYNYEKESKTAEINKYISLLEELEKKYF